MAKQRKRFVEPNSLHERLGVFSQDVRRKASMLPPGPEQDALLKKLHSADIATRIEDWANSPGLQPPK